MSYTSMSGGKWETTPNRWRTSRHDTVPKLRSTGEETGKKNLKFTVSGT